MAYVVAGGCVAFVALFFFMFGPEERVNNFSELARSINNLKAQRCLDFVRQELNDADSARLLSAEDDVLDRDVVFITYKAKNGYGAYVRGETSCKVSGDRVERALSVTESGRALDREIERLKERNNQLLISRTST